MKFRIQLKASDCQMLCQEDVPPDDMKLLQKFASDWFEHGEYVTLEFDTKFYTAMAVKVGE